jgi:hypothetical protein
MLSKPSRPVLFILPISSTKAFNRQHGKITIYLKKPKITLNKHYESGYGNGARH